MRVGIPKGVEEPWVPLPLLTPEVWKCFQRNIPDRENAIKIGDNAPAAREAVAPYPLSRAVRGYADIMRVGAAKGG